MGNEIGSVGQGSLLHTFDAANVADPPIRPDPSGPQPSTELYNTSGPNAGEPMLSDINQEQIGDCYFLSSIGALAQNDPSAIKNMIHDNGNGTYTVTFHEPNDGFHNLFGLTGHSYKDVKVTVDGKGLPDSVVNNGGRGGTVDGNNGAHVNWPGVLEEAYAKLKSGNHDSVDYQSINKGGDPAQALSELTGHSSDSYNPLSVVAFGGGANALADKLKSDFNAHKLIVIGTPDGIGGQADQEAGKTPYGLVEDHAYTVTNVYMKGGKEYVSLNNPWGIDQPKDIPVDKLPGIVDEVATNSLH